LLLQVGAAWLGLSAFFNAPDLTLPSHLVLIALLLTATAAGGFVAARIADQSHLLNGLLVGVTGILAGAVSNPGLVPVAQLLVIAQALSLVSGALGGLLARLVARRQAA
jgi:putative membrane protein (TIGR04086 family)